jgi:radical SAM superfamily enzyme YgiQ (UPF0313 family)
MTDLPPGRKKTILLVNPWIYDFAAYDFWIKPMGLMTLGAILRENGFHVQVIDCLNAAYETENLPGTGVRRTTMGTGKFQKTFVPKPDILGDFPRCYGRYGISITAFQKNLQSIPKPDMVLVTSMMTYWYPGVFEAIRQVKNAFPGVTVVAGGHYVTLCPDHARRSGADILISGPGEMHLAQLCRTLLQEELSFLPDFDDLNTYPYPAFDLLPENTQIPILTSRGCPFDCTYCASHILQPFFRRRDPDKVVEEIEFWYNHHGITHFAFYDDALLAKPDDMFIPLAQELIRRKVPCRLHCPNGLHLREITEEVATLMFQAGFHTIRFGFETSDLKRQRDTGGKTSNHDLEEAVFHLGQAGYKRDDIGIYLLCGLPGQSFAEVEESVNHVLLRGATPIIAEYSPIPGTALWNEAVASSPFDIENEPFFHNNTLLPCQSEKLTYGMYRQLKEQLRRQKGNVRL